MPSNNLFLFQILVNGNPLPEYEPKDDDFDYQVYSPFEYVDESENARVCYIEATPGDVYTARIKYIGDVPLNPGIAFDALMHADSEFIDSRLFLSNDLTNEINGKFVKGVLSSEQPYFVFLT
jgi:hypothetical protein